MESLDNCPEYRYVSCVKRLFADRIGGIDAE
jgi:hypothetical protein